MWIEIFKTGKHTDSRGTTEEFNGDRLDLAINNFTGKIPVYLGHSKPNYELAHIEELKADNGILKGRLTGDLSRFETVVKTGLNRISAGFKDIKSMALDHVALLGSTPNPAIKDLKAIQFNENNDIINIEFQTNLGGDMPDDNVNGILDKLTQKIESMFEKKKENPPDLSKLEELESKFSALESKYQTELSARDKIIEKLESRLNNSDYSQKENSFKNYLESKEFSETLTPAMKNKALRIMRAIDENQKIEYSEGDKKIETSGIIEFQELLKLIPKQIYYGEYATKEFAEADKTAIEAAVAAVDEFQKGVQ
jgi:hypothetical protein